MALFLTAFMVFWNGTVGTVLWRHWVRPFREKRLYRLGQATRGRVTGQREVRGTGVRVFVAYEFRASDGSLQTSEMEVSRFGRAAPMPEQQEVTVLYWPTQPQQSVISELGSYRILPGRASG